MGATRKSSRGVHDDTSGNTKPASTRSRKRATDRIEMDEPDESSQLQQKRRASEEGSGSGGGVSGHNESGGSNSGRRRSAGFTNLGSQDADEDEERQQFSNSQGVARAKVASTAAKPSKELLSEAKDEKKGNELSTTEKADLIKSMMRFLAMKGLSHDPATKKEMMDTVLGPKYRGKGVFRFILSKAAKKLTDTLGLRVKTLVEDSPYYVKDTYYVINALNHEDHAADILKGSGQAARGLLTVVLCIIYCSADKLVTEDDLFKKLHDQVDARIPAKASTSGRGATRSKTRAHVEGLGDVHDLLATLVKQHYLMKKSVTKPTADCGTDIFPGYAMGARGALEVGNLQIVTLMAETMGETVDPSALVELEEEGGSQSLSQAT